MPKIHPPHIVDRIKELLQTGGMSTRKIGKLLKVSYSKVAAIRREEIASGRLVIVAPLVPEPKQLPKVVNPDSEAYNRLHNQACVTEYVRCARCGGMIVAAVPCLACTQKASVFSNEFDCYLNELLTVSSSYPVDKSR